MNALPSDPSEAAALPLQVLVVDDTPTNRQILAVFLKKFGHRVDMAENGAKAVAMFAANDAYDLVVMDVMMPVMDGYEATRRIKAACGDRWVPVIFLSALDKDENLVNGLEAGGDDYLSKPVNFVVLEAKLRSLSRSIALRRELEDTRRTLQDYYDEREAENRLAEGVLSRMLHRPGLSDPALHYWMQSATNFSGDIVAAARADDGRFYVLLADATGHGLGATISVLPVLALFYDIVASGLPLEPLMGRLNRQLYGALPVGRFVACACLCIDPVGGCELWMGGIPRALLLDSAGNVLRELPARHLPLGIDDFDEDALVTETLEVPVDGGQLVLYSDGLVEACNSAGEEFGEAGLRAALAGVPANRRLQAAKTALAMHLGSGFPHDDATLVLVDLPPSTRH